MFFKKHIQSLQIKKGTQILMGAPAVPASPSLIRALKDLLPHHEEVKEVYVFMKGTTESSPVLTVGVCFENSIDKSIIPSIFASIGAVIQPYIEENEDVDMMALPMNLYDTVKAIPGAEIYIKLT